METVANAPLCALKCPFVVRLQEHTFTTPHLHSFNPRARAHTEAYVLANDARPSSTSPYPTPCRPAVPRPAPPCPALPHPALASPLMSYGRVTPFALSAETLCLQFMSPATFRSAGLVSYETAKQRTCMHVVSLIARIVVWWIQGWGLSTTMPLSAQFFVFGEFELKRGSNHVVRVWRITLRLAHFIHIACFVRYKCTSCLARGLRCPKEPCASPRGAHPCLLCRAPR